jgi:thioredoxin 1
MRTLLTTVIAITLMSLTACAGNDAKQTTKPKEDKMEVIHLTKAEFLKKVFNYEANPNEWKYEGDKPCIVDFFATWCGPCKALSPVLDSIAKEYDGKLVVYKIDVNQEEDLAAAFGVRSIPTLLFIPMTGKPTITNGSMGYNELKKIIDTELVTGK